MRAVKDGRHLSAAQQEVVRQKAVAAVLGGEKQVTVARLFGVSLGSVSRWVNKAKAKGVKALQAKKRGGRKPRLLKGWQAAWVARRIRDKYPDQLKLPFVLWTREAIQQLIQQRFGIRLAIRTVGDYLARWGLTPQKPAKSAYQKNDEAVRQWLAVDYPAVVKRAKAENALIYWGDEMGLRSGHWHGRSYSPKGKTPVVKTTGIRFGINMISALSNLGKLVFSIFEGTLVVPVFLEFLARLVAYAKGRKIILIVDSHAVHTAKAVKDWVEAQWDKIELVYLPGYSPELNPDELLNQNIKATVFKHERPRSKKHLKSLLRNKVYSIQKQPAKIISFFNSKHTRYASA